MHQNRFVIGSVRQGSHEVGEKFSAYEQGTIFLSGVCEAEDFLDEPALDKECLSFLKNIGGLVMRVGDISHLGYDACIAELEVDEASRSKYQIAMAHLFRNNLSGYRHQEPTLMTLPKNTALRTGDTLDLSYLSVLEPVGDGEYILKHDYPLERTQGPRFEKF